MTEVPGSIAKSERTTRRLLRAGLRDDSLPSSSDNANVGKQYQSTEHRDRQECNLMFHRLCAEVDAQC